MTAVCVLLRSPPCRRFFMAPLPEPLPSDGSQGHGPWSRSVPEVITPRSYQIELLELAKTENIIVYLETGCGKTHIAMMMLQHVVPTIRKPKIRCAVFLCPTVYLVLQQAKAIRECTDLVVRTYSGGMDVDAWNSETWETELETVEVFVMTPAILLHNLYHCFMSMNCIDLLIFDECHHASKRHHYACIMQDFYHRRSKDESYKLPRILGMTASPIDGKVDCQGQGIERELDKIERMLHAKLYTVKKNSELDIVVPRPLRKYEYYESMKTTNSVIQQFSQQLTSLKDECIRNYLGASKHDREVFGEACTSVERKMMKNIEKLCNSLHYYANELGIRCAIEAVVLLRKYDCTCDTETDMVAERKEVFLQKAFITLNSLLSQGCMSTPSAALVLHDLSEDSMKGQVLSRIENVEDLSAPVMTTIETFQVESTGASISTLSCVSLLHNYCARLAHDSFYTPVPEFSYSTGSSGVKCTVTLPTDALVQAVEGRPTTSLGDAKRVACLLACQRLYEAGALTDLLLLKSDENEYPIASTTAPEAPPLTEGKVPHPSHSTITPDAFSGSWLPGLASIELHAYAVTFLATTNDRPYVNFGLYLEADLGPEAGSIEVELQLTNRRLVNTKCSPCGTIHFDPEQLRDARLFQERIFSAVLDQKPGAKVSGEWSSQRLYLLLPLKEHQEPSNLVPSIDWNCIKNLISEVEHVPSNDDNDVPPAIPGSSNLVRLYGGYVSLDHVINSVVQTVHNGCIYCARELIPDLTAESPMVKKDHRYSSYLDYYEQKHKTTLKFLDQPMLRAKPLIQVHNLLTQRTTSERPAAEEQKAEALVELPLELCRIRVKGLSCGLANAVSLLPSFMHRLEGLLLAIQLRRSLRVSHPDIPADLMLKAITTSKCQESFSLEVLELLGDAFLEFSVSERLFLLHNRMQEGKLSKLRTSLICNTTLEKLGRERGLMGYIRDTQFSPKDWVAPGRANVSCLEASDAEDIQVHPRNKLKRTRLTGTLLQGKTIADVFEALIGAHYIHGGVDAAQAMMGLLGCEVGVDPAVREEARTRSHRQLDLLPDNKVAELETLLKYKFQNRGLLVEALTHASCPRRSGDCYQRLEFLGDAVLDFLITNHFYENSGKFKRDPGLLTDLRSAAVNNECFARVAVRHNLHMYLLHNSRDLAASVDGYVKFVHDSTANVQCHGWKGDGGPKVLSDLVESLAGAVFLDSNFDLDTVWRVFEQILRPLVTPETLRLEPIRELRELCQQEKFGELKFIKELGVKGDFLMTVTVQVKNEIISEAAQKSDKKSAKKLAAIQALAALKKRGYEHFPRRLLKRRALCAQKFSDLVDVSEEEFHPLVSVGEPSAAFQSGVQRAVGTCTSAGEFGSLPGPSDKAHTPDPSSSGAAQKPVDGCCETKLAASCSMSSTSRVQEQHSGAQCGVENTQKTVGAQAGRRDAVAVGTDPQWQAVELTSTIESKRTFATKSDMEAQPREPDPCSVASHPRNLQRYVDVRDAAPVQTNPKRNETTDFEKLCLAYRASINQGQNSVFDFIRPQRQAPTREFDVTMNQTTSTTTSTTLASMPQLHAMDRSQVAPKSEDGSVPLAEPLLSASEVFLNLLFPACQSTGAGTSHRVLCSPRNGHYANHHMRSSSSKRKEPCVLDAPSSVNGDAPSADHQDVAPASEPTFSPVMSGTEPVTPSQLDLQLDSSRLAPEPAPVAPEMRWQMARGGARSLLNVICMRQRWRDPEYSLVWKGGASHAPLFVFMVQTTISLRGQMLEVDVEGEPERDVKGAKDSAAAQLLAWLQEQGVPLG